MALLLIDEDLPRSLGDILKGIGHEVLDVRDVGLRGRSDEQVYAYAQERGAVLVTADMGFADARRFPSGSHRGIVVVRLPSDMAIRSMNQEVLRGLRQIEEEDLMGNLVIVEAGRVRIRKPR